MKTYEHPIRIVNAGGLVRLCSFHDWLTSGVSKVGRAQIRLNLGGMGGIGTFSLSHGWGAGKLRRWRIHEDDQAALLKWAEQECKRGISKTPRSTGRPRSPKKGPKPDPRQKELF